MKFSCVFVDMRIGSPRLKREYTECEAWRERVVDRLVALRPDLVIVASAQELPVVVGSDDDPELQGAAVARLIKRSPARWRSSWTRRARTTMSRPAWPSTPRRSSDVRRPGQQRSARGTGSARRGRPAVGRDPRRPLAVTCPTDPCPPVIGSMLVYRDHHHPDGDIRQVARRPTRGCAARRRRRSGPRPRRTRASSHRS